MQVLKTKEATERIEKQLKKYKKMTINECIESIFKEDLTSGKIYSIDMGWRYYNHLNKLFAPMSKSGVIHQVDNKMGPSRRIEKVWSLT